MRRDKGKRLRLGWDLRTSKRVIVIGSAPGIKFFAGTTNRLVSPACRRKMARQLIETCRLHGVIPQRLALALIGLGHEMLLGLVRR